MNTRIVAPESLEVTFCESCLESWRDLAIPGVVEAPPAVYKDPIWFRRGSRKAHVHRDQKLLHQLLGPGRLFAPKNHPRTSPRATCHGTVLEPTILLSFPTFAVSTPPYYLADKRRQLRAFASPSSRALPGQGLVGSLPLGPRRY